MFLAPTSSFIRVRFDQNIERFLASLSDYLANNSAEGTFFSQHDVRAGLGCRPYHIKVLSSIEQSGQTCDQVFRIVKDVGTIFTSFQGNILPVCVVSNLGTVSLKVKSNELISIIKYLSSRLMGSHNGSLSLIQNDDTVLITIGNYTGPQLESFENWLNIQLGLNSSIFPNFKGEIIELSEEFNNFPHYPVKLVGPLDFERYSGRYKLDSSFGDITLDDYSHERLLIKLEQICQGIGGEDGIIAKETFKGAGLSKVIPSDQIKFREFSLQIFKEMENLLKQVGAKKLLRILDLISNPFATSLDEELCDIISDSSGIELMPFSGIHIPVIRGSNAGSSIALPLHSCSIDQNLYGYPNHKNTRTPIICYPSEMPITSWNSLVGCNTSNGNTTTVKGAIIALNLQSSPFKKIGLSPENGFYFILPIIWIGVKQVRVQSFKDIVKGSRILQPIERSVDNTTPNNKQYSQRNSNVSSPASTSPPSAKSDEVENDRKTKGSSNNWTCPNCKLQIFSRRSVCFKCHTCRPEQNHPFPRKPPVTSNKPEGDVRDGDWVCEHCKGHNFANKLACFTCHKIRPGFEEALSIDDEQPKETKTMPGDWKCSKCKENVFAKRNRCYKCSNPRP